MKKRSTQMKNYSRKVSPVIAVGFSILVIALVTKGLLECKNYAFGCGNIDTISDDEIRREINKDPYRPCNEIMGRSCGDDNNRKTTGIRWFQLGGKCRLQYDFGCTSGCVKQGSSCQSFICYECA